mgnify:CR=1 FL=1
MSGGGTISPAQLAQGHGAQQVVAERVAEEQQVARAAQVVPDSLVGDYRDLETLRKVADGCDVVTFDHEHVPTEHLRTLLAEGVVVRPGPDALVHAQDKLWMRAAVERLGLPEVLVGDDALLGLLERAARRAALGEDAPLQRGLPGGRAVAAGRQVGGGRRADGRGRRADDRRRAGGRASS